MAMAAFAMLYAELGLEQAPPEDHHLVGQVLPNRREGH